MPHGMSGMTTYYISNEKDFEKYKENLTNGEEMKIMKWIHCQGASLEACITKNGVVVSPLIVELIGVPELTLYNCGWSGNEFYKNSFSQEIVIKAQEYAIKMGEELRKVGYKGYFEPDFLIDLDTHTLYLGEMNLRFSGFTPLINNTNISHTDIPLMLLHILEWMDFEYELDIKKLNAKWIQQESYSDLSFLHLKNVSENNVSPIKSGIYKLINNKVEYLRFAKSPNSIKDDNEAFVFSSAGKNSIIVTGDEIGGVFIKKRATINKKKLTEEAKTWVKGLTHFTK